MKTKMILMVSGVLVLLLFNPCESCFQSSCCEYKELEKSSNAGLNNSLFTLLNNIIEHLKPFEKIQVLLEKIRDIIDNTDVELTDTEPYEGYTIFGPEYSRNTYLVNIDGKIVHTWKSNYIQGFGGYLLENGEMLRLDLPFDNTVFVSGGVAGRVEKFDEDSNLLWEFEYSSSEYCAHHDIEPLPNGNVLLIAWEYKTRDEAITAGRNPDRLRSNSVWPDHIIEVEPSGSNDGTIVWEWHLWDHLIQDYDPSKENYGVIEDHPELVDINYGESHSDWTHTNAVDYNEQLDQILLSVHNLNEIWIIDHSTTTEEARGHTGGNSGKGGDLLYRWGNPQVYRMGDGNDQQFIGQHGANWIEEGCPGEGNILVFNNGNRRQGSSSVDEIVPPLNEDGTYDLVEGLVYGPNEPTWTYTKDDMYSTLLSNAQRLPNGNTLICSAQQGLFLEVSYDKEIVWSYQNILPTLRTNCVARVQRYSLDYPGIPEVESLDTTNCPHILTELIPLKNID